MTNKKPIILNYDIVNDDLFYNVKCYPLNENEFDILIMNRSNWKVWAINIFFASFGVLINIIFTGIVIILHTQGHLCEFIPECEINELDFYCLCFALILAALCLVIGKFSKGPCEKLKNKIKNYFNRNK